MDGPGGQRGGGATAEPVAVLEAAIQKMVQDAKTKALAKASSSAQPFIPSPRFQGARRGYLFSTRDQGTGYYLDPLQQLPTGDEEDGGDEGEEGGQRRAAAEKLDPEELLRRAEEEANIDEVQVLDARSLRRLVTQLEKKARENLELRMKYASEPMKFLDNEVDLLSIVREVGQAAGSPELYPVLVDGPAVPTLLGLLAHENADLAVEVVDLLQEMTDADAIEDSGEEARALVDALVEGNGLELLFQALSRFDESNEDEAAGVNKALATIEHMAEISPPVAELVMERTGLLKWLLARVRRRASDSNRLYASELLAILLQGHEANQRRLGQSNGIDTLLMAISPYKSRDPQDAEEEEYVENLVDVLCCCIMLPENRAAFVAAEGVELMFLLLKAKRASRYGAVKALDFACTRCPPACDRLVEVGGLAPLFGLFMGRTKVKGPKGDKAGRDVAQEMEERSVSLVSSLMQHVTKASLRDRVAAKFVEAEFEKTDMLVEMMFKFEDRVAAVEARLGPLYEAGEMDEDDVMSEQLDAGLFTLQGCVVVAAALWASGDAGLRKRLLALLHQRGRSLDMIREYLYDYYVGLGDDEPDQAAASSDAKGGGKQAGGGGEGEGARQRRRLSALLAAVGVDAGDAEAARRKRQGKQANGEAQAGEEEAPPLPPPQEEQDGDADMALDKEEGGAAAAAADGGGGGKEAAGARDGGGRAGAGQAASEGEGGQRGARSLDAGGGGGRDRGRDGPGRGGHDKSRSRSRSRDRSRERRADRDRDRERERGRDRDRDRKQRRKSKSRSRERRRRSRSGSGDRSRRSGRRSRSR